jgi:hypothetical protein
LTGTRDEDGTWTRCYVAADNRSWARSPSDVTQPRGWPVGCVGFRVEISKREREIKARARRCPSSSAAPPRPSSQSSPNPPKVPKSQPHHCDHHHHHCRNTPYYIRLFPSFIFFFSFRALYIPILSLASRLSFSYPKLSLLLFHPRPTVSLRITTPRRPQKVGSPRDRGGRRGIVVRLCGIGADRLQLRLFCTLSLTTHSSCPPKVSHRPPGHSTQNS